MKPFQATLFVHLTRTLEGIWYKGLFGGLPFLSSLSRLTQYQRTAAREGLGQFEKDCLELELTASVATIGRIRQVLGETNYEVATLTALVDELLGRLYDEMRGRFFWSLTLSETQSYSNPRKGWEQIIDRFPDAVTDIEEAHKCFALSRYPASVFHSLQIVESGLIELGAFILVKDPRSGWTAVANELKKIAWKKYEDRSAFEKSNGEFLEQMQGTVEGLKNAWRNKIGHVQGRLVLMTKDFAPDVAEEILFATRAFMRRLATGLPPAPDGEPTE